MVRAGQRQHARAAVAAAGTLRRRPVDEAFRAYLVGSANTGGTDASHTGPAPTPGAPARFGTPGASHGLRVRRIQSLLVRSVKQVLTTRPVVAPRTRLWAAGIAAVLAIAGVVALTVVNSGGGDSQPVADISSAPPPVTPPSSPAAPVAAPKPKPKAKPKPKSAINPLTGLKPSRNKVVAVKIDDTAGARPQVGLDRADVVYVEQVEGGLTRLVAIFNSHLPLRVG